MGTWHRVYRCGWLLSRASPYLGARLQYMAALRISEPELHILHRFARRDGLSLDIGANWGMYTAALLPLSRSVIAFEPNPVIVQKLRRAWPGVRVEACALGAEAGSATLQVPVMTNGKQSHGWGSIRKEGFLCDAAGVVTYDVPVHRLDDFALDGVGFIKIDVEGFEELVLDGAMETIRRDRPALLVEASEPPRTVARLEALGYKAEYLHDGGLHPFSEWHPELRTRRGGPPNNMLFTPN